MKTVNENKSHWTLSMLGIQWHKDKCDNVSQRIFCPSWSTADQFDPVELCYC